MGPKYLIIRKTTVNANFYLKLGVTALLLFVGKSNIIAQGTWTRKADFGGDVRSYAVGFTIGNKGYLGTGHSNTGLTKDFWEYDPANNTWTQKADFAGGGREYAVGFAIGSKGYIGTGYGSIGLTKDFWEYDPATNIWTQKADFGGDARKSAVGFAINNKGYIGTGSSVPGPGISYSKDFWEYNPDSDTWTQKANIGGEARAFSVGFAIGNKGYIGTGPNSNTYAKDFWEYDPATNIWTQKADFGGDARIGAIGFAIGNKGYIGTGYSVGSVGYSKDFWEYDPTTNTWTRKSNFGGDTRNLAVGFAIGNKGYVGTGTNGGKTKDLWEFDPAVITNISLIMSSENISVYPNPNNGSFTIVLNKKTDGPVLVKLVDLTGRLVFEENKSANDLSVQTNNLANGSYVVEVFANKETQRVRIAISR